ncbi:hypothetical protein V1517DRAFT_235910, partial [Lipomyces orientalis]
PLADSSPEAPHSPSSDLERRLLQLFIDLHASDPTHDIFGEPAKGLIRLPLYTSRTNGQSWQNICKKIGSWVANEMESGVELDKCWMSRYCQISISAQSARRCVTLKKIYAVRLL